MLFLNLVELRSQMNSHTARNEEGIFGNFDFNIKSGNYAMEFSSRCLFLNGITSVFESGIQMFCTLSTIYFFVDGFRSPKPTVTGIVIWIIFAMHCALKIEFGRAALILIQNWRPISDRFFLCNYLLFTIRLLKRILILRF